VRPERRSEESLSECVAILSTPSFDIFTLESRLT
jgi:hypothetical protein